MYEFNGIACDPETEVAVNVGSAGSFACVILSTLNPGDEAVVFSPFYSYHVNLLKLFGAQVRFVDLRPPDWSYDPAEFEAAFNERTRVVVLCTPANPSGKVFNAEELRHIAGVANRHNAWIATDEIYEYITYGKKHLSIGSLPEAREPHADHERGFENLRRNRVARRVHGRAGGVDRPRVLRKRSSLYLCSGPVAAWSRRGDEPAPELLRRHACRLHRQARDAGGHPAVDRFHSLPS